MSEFIIAFLLGVLEGATEFIPISSTGHLILVGDALSFTGPVADTFKIAIQLGAILAVVVLYPAVFKRALTPRHWFSRENRLILTAIAPAMGLGFLFYDLIKTHLFGTTTVMLALFIGGIIMIIAEKTIGDTGETASFETLTFKQALTVGICQCAALWPGMSRSASTIIGGLISGMSHKFAAEFSFIIAVPVMVAAVGYDMLKSAAFLDKHSLILIAIGFTASFVVAVLSMLTFLKILSRFKLIPFAVYRIVLSGALMGMMFL
jgi:undecaprenyl-diphosphatase